jgi:hypothetical protein
LRRRLLVRIAIAACATLLAADVGLSVFALRDGVFGWRPVPPFRGVSSPQQREWLAAQRAELDGRQKPGVIGLFDAELGWCGPKSRSTAPKVRPSFSYEAHGARSEREYADAPPAGVVRLVCFGDSFTHGDEVSNGDTWELQLEALDARYEALNYGVGGYGTDQALLRFRREGLHGARVACIGYMVENIGRNANRYRPLWYPATMSCGAKPRLVIEGDQLRVIPLPYATRAELIGAIDSGRVIDDLAEHEYWSAEARMTWLRFSGFLRMAAGWWCYHRRDVARLYGDPESVPYRTSIELLVAFAREAKERGAEHALVLVFHREPDLRNLALAKERFWKDFVAELRSRGVDVLDTSDELSKSWTAAHEDPSQPRLYQGTHYSPAANAVIARALHAWLEERLGAKR